MENHTPRPGIHPNFGGGTDPGLILARWIVRLIQERGCYNKSSQPVIQLDPIQSQAIKESPEAQSLLSEWGYHREPRI